LSDFSRFFGRCNLVFELFKKRPGLFLNGTQEDTFVPNLVQIGQETAEKSCREKKAK